MVYDSWDIVLDYTTLCHISEEKEPLNIAIQEDPAVILMEFHKIGKGGAVAQGIHKDHSQKHHQ